jgi:hypothetical protein
MDGSDRCRVMLCTLKTVCCKQGAMYVSNPNQGISSSESQNIRICRHQRPELGKKFWDTKNFRGCQKTRNFKNFGKISEILGQI